MHLEEMKKSDKQKSPISMEPFCVFNRRKQKRKTHSNTLLISVFSVPRKIEEYN